MAAPSQKENYHIPSSRNAAPISGFLCGAVLSEAGVTDAVGAQAAVFGKHARSERWLANRPVKKLI
jgi:hypothetical protein